MKQKSFLVVLVLITLMIVLVAGCSGGGNTVQTTSSEDVGSAAKSNAQASPETTWEAYIRDSIAEQVREREAILNLRQRYENPETTNSSGDQIVKDIDISEDRTTFATNNNSATAKGDFDILLTFANGDTDTRTCKLNVSLEFSEDDGVWYVINPAPLAIFSVCTP